MSGAGKPLLKRVRAAFAQAADPSKAAPMRAYMKSAMPYHGVPTPLRRRLERELFRGLAFTGAADWERGVRALWRGARFREERYAALDLCGHRASRAFQTPDAMPLYEEIVVDGAWWDYVDDVASHRVGFILSRHPKAMKPLMRKWSLSENLWKRRTAILSQLGFKKDTDLALLDDCIRPSLDSREFFLQKAIGWALRQYAWTDPGWVRRRVARLGGKLKPLSRREALKNI